MDPETPVAPEAARREVVRELAFVDPGVSDPATLIGGVRTGVEAHLLTAHEPALTQIARVVAGKRDLEAIHIIAHGKPGEVRFSAGALTREGIAREASALSGIGATLSVD